jgi:hypothetical protein
MARKTERGPARAAGASASGGRYRWQDSCEADGAENIRLEQNPNSLPPQARLVGRSLLYCSCSTTERVQSFFDDLQPRDCLTELRRVLTARRLGLLPPLLPGSFQRPLAARVQVQIPVFTPWSILVRP